MSGESKSDARPSLLPPGDTSKKCLVLDLDNTLLSSTRSPTDNMNYIIPIGTDVYYIRKRPGVEAFLVEMAKYYEIVVYTTSLSKYADPLLDKLDPEGVISYRLYREHCVQHETGYVKDLSLLGRDISTTIIVDDWPMSTFFAGRQFPNFEPTFDNRFRPSPNS